MANFLLTVDQAIEFYKRCAEAKAETLEERLVIMKQMTEERRAFIQTTEQLEKRLKGKKVLQIKKGLPNDNSRSM